MCVSLSPVFQVLGVKLPNMLGRAEKLTFQFSYGTKETSYGLSFFKPQAGHFERKYVPTDPTCALSLLARKSATAKLLIHLRVRRIIQMQNKQPSMQFKQSDLQ